MGFVKTVEYGSESSYIAIVTNAPSIGCGNNLLAGRRCLLSAFLGCSTKPSCRGTFIHPMHWSLDNGTGFNRLRKKSAWIEGYGLKSLRENSRGEVEAPAFMRGKERFSAPLKRST